MHRQPLFQPNSYSYFVDCDRELRFSKHSNQTFPEVFILDRFPRLYLPSSSSPINGTANTVRNVLRISQDLDSRNISPRSIRNNPLDGSNTGQQLHTIVATLAAAEINYLNICEVKMIGEANSGSASRDTPWVFVTRPIGEDFDGSGVGHQNNLCTVSPCVTLKERLPMLFRDDVNATLLLVVHSFHNLVTEARMLPIPTH